MGLKDHKTICFDLDGTLCTNTSGNYEAAEPFPWAVERVNALAAAGHRIVVFTARGAATGLDWEKLTRAQLERWGVHYDELCFGKPSADVYVDDRAVQTLAWRWGDGSVVPGFARTISAGGDLVPGLAPPHLTALVEVGRTFGGRPFRLGRHADRLRQAALAAGLGPIPLSREICDAVLATLAEVDTETEDVSFTISLSSPGHAAYADALEIGLDEPLHVACRPVRQAVAGLRPLLAAGTAPGRISLAAATVRKCEVPAGWPLFVQRDWSVASLMGGQLGIVQAGAVSVQRASPPTIAGDWLDQLADDLGLELVERPLRLAELEASEEAFVAGLPFAVLPLGSLNGEPVWGAEPGPVTGRLLEAWSSGVGVDVAAQTATFVAEAAPIAAPQEQVVG